MNTSLIYPHLETQTAPRTSLYARGVIVYALLKAHRLVLSMSRRDNYYGNAVAESFFQLRKRERIKWKIYTDRAQARSDVFDYIELFYNPRRRHGFTDQLSPVEFERQYFLKNGTV